MNIGLIVTGGTLDSVRSESGLQCHEVGGLIDFIANVSDDQDDLTIFKSPWRQDSSQLRFEQILALADTLAQTQGMDAVLLGVGTDTLAYLAPTLWALSRRFPAPVVLVSGMQPWWMPDSDGAANVRDALAYIHQKPAGVEVVSAGRRLSPLNLRKFSHLSHDPFRNTIPLQTGSLEQVLQQIPHAAATQSPMPPELPWSPVSRNPVVPWLVVHPALTGDLLLRSLSPDTRHVVLSGYSGGTLPHWLLAAIPSGIEIHVVSQQWGPMCPEDYEASSTLLGRGIHFWNLAGETLTSLLAVSVAFGLGTGETLDWLRAIEKTTLQVTP